ncbi:amino acid/amide ABC transporter membrane protein 2, HAAT family /amino acid/amide ABC transporter ATP-binding protein 1, HAAT family [Thermomonospora echinospora]|uniref:Amino acid/amide ABC transporter membrane protein 2, HAAT family /amino acid/amide ABC transporter ATP-binding protein 1, HAAT family n=1 Tax=Thermomonospora echinospora TaxID=1992 RepID=A0A1H5YMM3_9ACTN|nr:branched-chain amino acid ABC transporter ATP-binding protein/permease [Thermomonospora echinospora]SEG25409.1 amino acid/amide ABC transporter membrane protein 2, HAAT family /amino acid/amide ABC transporter ATP-binding protein 1, HAAT family [Thermomonospora echinospora]
MSEARGTRSGAARRAAPWLVLVAAAAALPLLSGDPTITYLATTAGIYVLVGTGLNLMFGYTGQVSLGQGALVAVGAYTTGILMADHDWTFWAAAPVAVLVAVGAGTLMALPAFRLSSWYIALVTLGAAMAARSLLVEFEGLTGGWSGLIGIPRPVLGPWELGERGVFWLVLAVNVVLFAMVRTTVDSRLGRGMMAVRDAPEMARSVGVAPARMKLFAFACGGATAGLGGALLAVHHGLVTPDDFTLDFSILFLLVVIIGGAARLVGPIIGTLLFFALPELLTGLAEWRGLIYGAALLVLMVYAPQGIAGEWERLRARRRASGTPSDAYGTSDVSDASGTDVPVEVGPPRGEPLGVELVGVRKSFGGVHALQGVDLTIEPGTVHAIVGPNGSGKTTLLNVISRLLRQDGGRVLLGTEDVSRATAERLARHGVARVFQTPRLLGASSLRDNVLLGAYARERTGGTATVLRLPWARRERAELTEEADRLLADLGLAERADEEAAALPHGEQRLLEVARALMTRPRLLLMDEPAAGLTPRELESLGRLIRAIRDAGTTVVLVEHHIELVASVADVVTVLDRGRLVTSGSPQDALGDARVVEVYLGAPA